MAASAAVSVIARSWRGHRSDCRGSLRPSSNNGSVPGATSTSTSTKTRSKKASTLPPLTGIPVMQDDRRSRSTSLGSRIKDFFRSTVRRQFRVSSSPSSSPGGDSFSGTKGRSKSHSPRVVTESNATKSDTPRTSRTRDSASAASYGAQDGYSCSCSIEVLQESPRAGTRRLLHYNGISSSHNSVEVDSLYTRPEHDGGQTEESSQGATDSLCDPWEQSTSSTCTSTSSPRLRVSSCASQCSRPTQGGNRGKPRRRAFSSSSNHSTRVDEAEHIRHHRPRTNSSRLPTPSSARVESPGGVACSGPSSLSLPAATTPNSTSTRNSRGIHIKNFRSRLPKLKSPTTQTKASFHPTRNSRKAFWPIRHKTEAKKQVKYCVNGNSIKNTKNTGKVRFSIPMNLNMIVVILSNSNSYLILYYALAIMTFRFSQYIELWYATMVQRGKNRVTGPELILPKMANDASMVIWEPGHQRHGIVVGIWVAAFVMVLVQASASRHHFWGHHCCHFQYKQHCCIDIMTTTPYQSENYSKSVLSTSPHSSKLKNV